MSHAPSPSPPVVLVIAGGDPSGGAGLAADIQTLTALGAHPAPVVAALTVQDTNNVRRLEAVATELVIEQAQCVLQDMPVAAVKLGLLATAATGAAVASLLAQHPVLPLVVDPVLRAGGGAALADDALLDVYRHRLLPLATLATPNGAEARRLGSAGAELHSNAEALLAGGVRNLLITGGDEDTPEVLNTLYARGQTPREFRWPRLPGTYHGSGCTLASAAAALLARGQDLPDAVEGAQRYTWETLKNGWVLGAGQRIPNRGPRP